MRNPEARRASKRAYYERHKAELQQKSRERYAEQRASGVKRAVLSRRRRVAPRVDEDRKKASRIAYYTRNRATLQLRAQERMARLREAQGAEGACARKRYIRSYRLSRWDIINYRRLNIYRKHWMKKHGVSQFLKNFRGRVQAPHGWLLEHWDHETLQFHRPAALARTRQFYVVFAPGDVAGIYLAWYQVARLNGAQQQAFHTPEAAIAAFEEWYRLEHGDHQPDPPPPSERFTVEAYREYMRQVGSNSVYQQPDQSQASEGTPVAVSANAPELSIPGTPAPPYTLPSPPSSSAGRSAHLPSSPQSQPGAARTPHSPPSSPSTSRPHRSSSHRTAPHHLPHCSSTTSSAHHHSSPSKHRTATAGGVVDSRAQAPAALASSSSRAPAPAIVTPSPSAAASRSRASSSAPLVPARSGDAQRSRSQATSPATPSSRDVASWVESTSAAMERMSIRPVEIVEVEGVSDLPDDATTYVVGVPMVFTNWRAAHEAGEQLRAAGITTSRLRTARSKEQRLQLIESFRQGTVP
ncbi:hypothetical protein EV122DRAFT_285015 [Schizophyllum commune]